MEKHSNVIIQKNEGTSLEMKANIRIQVYQRIINLTQNDEYSGAKLEDTKLETFSELEQASTQEPIMKELGIYYGDVNYDDYWEVQSEIEGATRKRLVKLFGLDIGYFEDPDEVFNVADYEYVYRKLLAITSSWKPRKRSALKYEKMPEYYTFKKIGSGCFGKAFLIVKADNQPRRFQYEEKKDLKGKKNLFIMKHITFPVNDRSLLKDLPYSLDSELRFGYSIIHPNICTFLGAYSSNSFCTLIYEYLCCGSIYPIINDKDCISDSVYIKRLLFYSAQVILALEYLHERKIYHTDIKEDNICLDYRGYAKLIDFGMALHNQKIPNTSGLVDFISKAHFKYKLNFPVDVEDNDDYYDFYLNRLNNGGMMYEIDIFGGVSIFYYNQACEYLEGVKRDENFEYEAIGLARIGCITSGFTTTYDETYPVPTAKELRMDKFYESMDFARLLLRKFNLERELELDLEILFIKYTTKKLTSNYQDLVFSDDNKRTFQRKNEKEYLVKTHKSYSTIFSEITE